LNKRCPWATSNTSLWRHDPAIVGVFNVTATHLLDLLHGLTALIDQVIGPARVLGHVQSTSGFDVSQAKSLAVVVRAGAAHLFQGAGRAANGASRASSDWRGGRCAHAHRRACGGCWHLTDHEGRIVQAGVNVGVDGERRAACFPGGAWAVRRELFPIYDRHITGGGDTAMIEGWMGLRGTFFQGQMSPAWLADFQRWADESRPKVMGRMTTLNGDGVHLFHGSRANRRYIDRSRWLKDHDYDPATHMEIAPNGLLRWTAAAPVELKHLCADYLRHQRGEDEGLPVLARSEAGGFAPGEPAGEAGDGRDPTERE